ncbi:hypothetical protein CL1_0580 [Thermococcus cleftensis]|uniref:Uncharacterized protein n=1 Tax=Thermococcus cleftensis (strain DSM 27260 / KACC 17922 / CL1) TaxID=163003 RepID=I3ZSV3_THECF|nr:hypothetical protein [Thermococcus cleftensis]AFL94787.1 hypothetical protein CL1_0580 [Thermococcus cleftensis]
MRVFIYNAAGLTVPVEVEPGLPFKFTCTEEECGRKIVIEGVVRPASEEEFTRVLEKTVKENSDFEKIREITARKLVFEGKVNGKEVLLPVESFEDFARRFLEEVLVLR